MTRSDMEQALESAGKALFLPRMQGHYLGEDLRPHAAEPRYENCGQSPCHGYVAAASVLDALARHARRGKGLKALSP